MSKRVRRIVWAICLAFPFLALAELPGPDPYNDRDESARAVKPKPGARAHFRKELNATLSRDPDNVVALTLRGYLFVRSGDEMRARRDYERALTAASYGSPSHRQALWSFGWALYDMQDIDGALRVWELCARLHGGRPSWVPYTYALAYWTRRDTASALAWYDAAVRSDPRRGDAASLVELVAHWRPAQRKEMISLFDAWVAGKRSTDGS